MSHSCWTRLLLAGLLVSPVFGCSTETVKKTVYNFLRAKDCEEQSLDKLAPGGTCNKSYDKEYEAYQMDRKRIIEEAKEIYQDKDRIEWLRPSIKPGGL